MNKKKFTEHQAIGKSFINVNSKLQLEKQR